MRSLLSMIYSFELYSLGPCVPTDRQIDAAEDGGRLAASWTAAWVQSLWPCFAERVGAAAARYSAKVISLAAFRYVKTTSNDWFGNKTVMAADVDAAALLGYCRHFLSVLGCSGVMLDGWNRDHSVRSLIHVVQKKNAVPRCWLTVHINPLAERCPSLHIRRNVAVLQ